MTTSLEMTQEERILNLIHNAALQLSRVAQDKRPTVELFEATGEAIRQVHRLMNYRAGIVLDKVAEVETANYNKPLARG